MSRQTWKELISNDFVSAGAAFASYTTAKTVLPPGALIDFPKNYFTLGKKLKVEVMGGISNRVTGPDTTTFSVMLGAVVASTTGAINLTTTANTLRPFKAIVSLEVQVGGTAAQFMSNWDVTGVPFCNTTAVANFAAGSGYFMGPDPPALGTAFDATAALTLDFFVAQSFSGAGNGIQIRQYRVFAEN